MMPAFTSLVRSLGRHRLFAVLNIGGLALGIAVFLVLLLYVRFETGYDRALPGADRIWVVSEQYTRPGDPSTPDYSTLGNELLQLRGDFPQIEGTRVNTPSATVLQGSQATAADLATVDGSFFDLFPYPAVAGDPKRTLTQPDGIVLTETAARKYFGDQPAIGQTLTIKINDATYLYRVGAVIRDLPTNSTINDEMFVPLVQARFANEWWDHWGSTSLTTLLRFPDAAAAKAFEGQLPGFLARHAYPGGNVTKETYHQFLTPLTALHLIEPADRAIVTTLSIVGALTLLIAVVNYVNLATARAGLRAREVAVRKALGGSRRQLIVQFLGEAVATVALAALIGLALAELALPFLNAAGGTKLALDYVGGDSIVPLMLLLVLVVGGIAGLYPAFLLSSFRPAAVLASARAPGGGRMGTRLRGVLVVFQFAVAIAFAISTAVMIAQTVYVANADVGFRRDGLIVLRSFADGGLEDAQKASLFAAMRTIPGVISVGSGINAPGEQNRTNTDTLSRPATPDRAPSIVTADVGPGYFETIGIRLVAGRRFDPSRPGDDIGLRPEGHRMDTGLNLLLNESAVKAIGFSSAQAAIGEQINGLGKQGGRVIGVVADQRFTSPREALRPTAYYYTSARIADAFATVRFTGDPKAMIDTLEATWKRIAPQVPFAARTARDNLYLRWYKADAQRSRLFTIGAVLAVVIGCIGLYGLAAFDTSRRVKEIGIRKTLGASTADVLRLLLLTLMRPVVVATLIAWPLAYVAMQRWLSGFDDRIALSPLYFLGVSVVALGIAAGTVVGQSWRVARAEPARALRYE